MFESYGYELSRCLGLVNNSFQQWLHNGRFPLPIRSTWSSQLPKFPDQARPIAVHNFFPDRYSTLSRPLTTSTRQPIMDQFKLFLIYIEHGAICGTVTAKLTGCFVPRTHSGYIWSFYRHNKNGRRQNIKADQAWKQNKYDILFTTKYMKPPAHIHLMSDSRCNVTRSARMAEHRSCMVNLY